MTTFIDPAGRARAAIVTLVAFAAVAAVGMIATLLGGTESDAAGIAALVQLIAMLVALITVSMWVHRVNANAHAFADGLSITPGWNVGWFFVPVANLWKPFEGVKETWQASVDAANWPAVPVPTLLRAWWGCWLAGNIAGNVSFQVGRAAGAGSTVSLALDLLSSATLIAAAALLIAVIRRLGDLQRHASAARVFA